MSIAREFLKIIILSDLKKKKVFSLPFQHQLLRLKYCPLYFYSEEDVQRLGNQTILA